MNIWDVCSFILGIIVIVFMVALFGTLLLVLVLGVYKGLRGMRPKKPATDLEFDIDAKKASLYLHHDGLEMAFIAGAGWAKRYTEARRAR